MSSHRSCLCSPRPRTISSDLAQAQMYLNSAFLFSHICQHLPSLLDSLLEDGVMKWNTPLPWVLWVSSVFDDQKESSSHSNRCCIQTLITEKSFYSDLPHQLLWHDEITCRIHVQTWIKEISQTKSLCGHVIIMSVSVVTVLQTLLRMPGWLILTLDTTVDVLQTVMLSFNHHHRIFQISTTLFCPVKNPLLRLDLLDQNLSTRISKMNEKTYKSKTRPKALFCFSLFGYLLVSFFLLLILECVLFRVTCAQHTASLGLALIHLC